MQPCHDVLGAVSSGLPSNHLECYCTLINGLVTHSNDNNNIAAVAAVAALKHFGGFAPRDLPTSSADKQAVPDIATFSDLPTTVVKHFNLTLQYIKGPNSQFTTHKHPQSLL